MRPLNFAQASVLTAAALLGAASAASAQSSSRTLNWPGKTAAPVEALLVAAPPQGFRAAPMPVPPPFIAFSAGPARVNNRYSPRSGAPRLASRMPVRPAPVVVEPAYPAPVYTAPVRSAPVYAPPAYTPPAYTPPVYVPPPVAMPEPATDYGPPVIPNMVKPTRRVSTPPPVEVAAASPAPVVAQPAPAPVIAAPAPRTAKSVPAKALPQTASVQAGAAPSATAAPSGDRPFIRPASANGPRFYSVHREYGGTPDATFRSKPEGAATERLPAGFFAAGESAAAEEEEAQDDAETRAAAVRTAEKQLKAKSKKR